MGQAVPFLAIAGSAISAYGQIQAGKARAKGLAQQAALEKVRARGEAIKYQRQGIESLKGIVRTNATLNARAAAGGIDPFSGSAAGLARFSESEGSKEFVITEDNQIIAREGGSIQAQLYMDQAKQAKRGALFAAAGTLLSGASSASSTMGGAPTTQGANVSYATSGPSGSGLLV